MAATQYVAMAVAVRTISATFGLNAGIIDRAQFSVLVTVVVLTAVVPDRGRAALLHPGGPAGSPDAGRPADDPGPDQAAGEGGFAEQHQRIDRDALLHLGHAVSLAAANPPTTAAPSGG